MKKKELIEILKQLNPLIIENNAKRNTRRRKQWLLNRDVELTCILLCNKTYAS